MADVSEIEAGGEVRTIKDTTARQGVATNVAAIAAINQALVNFVSHEFTNLTGCTLVTDSIKASNFVCQFDLTLRLTVDITGWTKVGNFSVLPFSEIHITQYNGNTAQPQGYARLTTDGGLYLFSGATDQYVILSGSFIPNL